MKSVELFLALSLATTVGLSASRAANANDYGATILEESADVDTHLIAGGGEGGEGGESLSPGEQANADFLDKMSSSELLSELQQGGYVIYFRHAQTEKDYAD